MNAYVFPPNGHLSVSSDYYIRTLDYLAQRHPEVDPSSILAWSRPALGRLREGYKELSRRTDRMDYTGDATQLAYLLAYTPHHAGQLQRAMSRFGGLLARRPDAEPGRVVCLAAGPGSELLGCSFAQRHPAPPGGALPMKACLVDKSPDCWRYGRAIVNYHLQHADHRNVVSWTEVSHEGWNIATERMPVRVEEEIAAADLITCMNVLTEITAAGPTAWDRFRRNMGQVLATMKAGASLLCSDYAGYPSSLELLNDIRVSAQRLGMCVTDVDTTDEQSSFADVKDRRVMTAFYSDNAKPRKRMHTASLLIRKI